MIGGIFDVIIIYMQSLFFKTLKRDFLYYYFFYETRIRSLIRLRFVNEWSIIVWFNIKLRIQCVFLQTIVITITNTINDSNIVVFNVYVFKKSNNHSLTYLKLLNLSNVYTQDFIQFSLLCKYQYQMVCISQKDLLCKYT